MKQYDRIELNPEIMFGKPVIKGTRITVDLILRKLAAGLTPEQIMKDHPHITIDDIHAVQEFAADYITDDEIILSRKVES